MAGSDRLRHGDVGYAALWTPDVERAEKFYSAALEWEIAPGSVPEGREVRGISPKHGLWGGRERLTLFLCFHVDDVSAVVEKVRAAGGKADEPSEEPYGTMSRCQDDQGLPFAVYHDTTGARATAVPRPGDLGYITVETPDSARARAFFGAALDWEFRPGRSQDGWNVASRGADIRPMTGLRGGRRAAIAVPLYVVSDVEAAVARVRAAGGTSTDPERHTYGDSADCADDQGLRFFLARLG
ncbi:hypothetical protein SAMN05421505_13832 [Sinosporangium album]|uniref:VOC domain-containing protein n=1 Tax=Sinosporangium album TaxID=504805 RepID=A0A1G8IPR6_9ACTN|nr:VOC family protein [Sinosporangium album]SDI20767.1 hypothetical protein SAMN05421505_13832 [Sinosporangium album]